MTGLRVAVSTRTVYTRPDDPHDGLSRDWAKVFQTFDLTPILIPNYQDPTPLLDLCDALILTGGDDAPLQWPPPTANPRDTVEYRLLTLAMERNMPVLGVCRGLQILNLWFGGGVTQHLHEIEANHVAKTHKVLLSGLFSEKQGTREHTVNSYHQHGVLVSDLAEPLEKTAITRGNVVEALIHPHHPIAAVQWHPERQGSFSRLDHYFFGAFLRQ